MKKIKMFTFALCMMLLAIVTVSAADTSLPAETSGVITLNNDVDLASTYNVSSGTTLTIDLNGHTLKGPSSGYLIDNAGTLTIVDNGSSKGAIDCSNNAAASCLRNQSEMTVNGVTLNDSTFITIKNEANATLSVNNSNINLGRGGVGVENFGKADIVGTTIKGLAIGSSFGVWTISDGSSPETLIKDSTITNTLIQDSLCSDITNGKEACNSSSSSNENTLKVKIENTTTNKNIQHSYGSVEVDSVANLKKVAKFATENTEIIVDADVVSEEPIKLKSNVKLTLTGDDTRKVVQNGDGTYTIEYIDADYTALNEALEEAKAIDTTKYIEESVKALQEAIKDAENVEKGLKANEQDKIDSLASALTTAMDNLVAIEENDDTTDEEDAPETLDAGLAYVGLALLGLGATVVTTKKLRNN